MTVKSNRERAAEKLDGLEQMSLDGGTRAAQFQETLVFAVLAIADELAGIREELKYFNGRHF